MKTMVFGLWVGVFYFENQTEDLMCGGNLLKSRLQMGGTLFNAQKNCQLSCTCKLHMIDCQKISFLFSGNLVLWLLFKFLLQWKFAKFLCFPNYMKNRRNFVILSWRKIKYINLNKIRKKVKKVWAHYTIRLQKKSNDIRCESFLFAA